ncbi:MAG: D-2-hydroxyacid dehydrogenase [Acidobacteria bacterium]|nr:D-2-hydroxyacid dehydrogenase [Acidobacteriota bacterium]
MHILVAIFSDMVAWTIPPERVDDLRRWFPDNTFVDARSDAEMERLIPPCDVAFTSRLTARAFAAAPRLRWVHSPAAGVGSMLFPAMLESAVMMTNSRGMNAGAVAEHALLLMLATTRRLPEAVRAQDRREWISNDLSGLPLLRGKTVGIVGLGAIGREVARMASALGLRVIGTRRETDTPVPPGVDEALPPERLAELLAAADTVVLAAPLTAETRGMIGVEQFRQMKRSAWLINVARGKLVRENDLVDALRAGTIAGSALDVVEHEPLDPSSPLWSMPNVLLTPHVGGFREDYWEAATALFAENLERYAAGECLANIVDKRAGY